MNLSSMSYNQILSMPVNRLEQYLNWKIKHDRENEKAKADSLDQIKM
jgi:hypothetical protein